MRGAAVLRHAMSRGTTGHAPNNGWHIIHNQIWEGGNGGEVGARTNAHRPQRQIECSEPPGRHRQKWCRFCRDTSTAPTNGRVAWWWGVVWGSHYRHQWHANAHRHHHHVTITRTPTSITGHREKSNWAGMGGGGYNVPGPTSSTRWKARTSPTCGTGDTRNVGTGTGLGKAGAAGDSTHQACHNKGGLGE